MAPVRGTLDMFQVIHYAVMGTAIANSMPYHSFQLPLDYAQMLKIACVNGARVANLESKTGCLEKGRLADIVLVGRNDFDQYPSTDPLVTLAEMTTGRDVRTVIVDGRVVMKDREFLTVDMEPMRRRMAKQYKVILDRYDQAIS
jgi:5-methylthioadenosine/S-adenosylhomocysteine deaminase